MNSAQHILRLRIDRLSHHLELLQLRHPPGSRHHNPECFDALRNLIRKRELELQRSENPWLRVKRRIEPLGTHRWFHRLMGVFRGVAERAVFSGIIPEKIGRWRILDLMLDLES